MIIKSSEEQPLFQRKRIEAIAEGKTPREEEVRQEIARQLNKQEELIFVKRIKQQYGMQKSKINAFVYENAEAVSKFERKKKEKKQEIKEAKEKPEKAEKTEKPEKLEEKKEQKQKGEEEKAEKEKKTQEKQEGKEK